MPRASKPESLEEMKESLRNVENVQNVDLLSPDDIDLLRYQRILRQKTDELRQQIDELEKQQGSEQIAGPRSRENRRQMSFSFFGLPDFSAFAMRAKIFSSSRSFSC
jgi:hypothetical protein